MQIVYQLAPLIADIISAHCPGTGAREEFLRACLHGDWYEAIKMVECMLAEPQYLRGHQEARLREFLQLVQLNSGVEPIHAAGSSGPTSRAASIDQR